MKLNLAELNDKSQWEKAGIELPKFDLEKVCKNTAENPTWVHFGAGNIFRAFIANLQQNLLDEGKAESGIVAAEGYDYEIVDKMNKDHDNLTLCVTLKADGSIDKKVIASVVESYAMDSERPEWDKLKKIFANPSLQMASFTITEKGYSLRNSKGELIPSVEEDFKNGPAKPQSYIGKLVALVYERYTNGKLPIALVSMDNCSHNGEKLYDAVKEFAKAWTDAGLCDKDFMAYIDDPNKVGFPWSMIDKITPRPDDSVKQMLLDCGFEDAEPIVTSKNTYLAPFVNAEEAQYLVIENKFPNGRPKLEDAGVIFTDRDTVTKVERMKVCTCLNPLHTALAVYGCLLGYKQIWKETKDKELNSLIQTIGYVEGMPVVTDPGIIEPKSFIDEVVTKRIPNPFMPDTPQRIATDTSQKLGVRYGETIKAYMASDKLDVNSLTCIPLVLAGWVRYIMGVDDNGEKFELSPDPMLAEVTPYVSDIKLGDKAPFDGLKKILSNPIIFGVDLYEAGLGEKVEGYFEELVAGKGAIRNTLKKYCR